MDRVGTLGDRAAQIALRDVGKTADQARHLTHHYNHYWWVLRPGVDVEAVKARGYPLDSEVAGPMDWCGMAISNWIRQALDLPYWDWRSGWRRPLAGHPFGYFLGGADQIEEWAKLAGRWRPARLIDPIPAGAVATIDKGAARPRHALMIVRDLGDGRVETVEGNLSNQVGRHIRRKNQLRGWALWW